jgi:agmatinase
MSQRTALEYIRGGITPFFRLPTISFESSEPYSGCDAVVLGVPFDRGTTYRPGARFAPYEIRRVSALVQGYHPAHRIDVFEALRAVDGGNVAFPPFSDSVAREAIELEISRVVSAGAVPFVVGGDHSIALPAMRAVSRRHGPLAVVHVDAHLDTSDPSVWGEAYHHGTPIRHAISEGVIEKGQLHQVGVRAPWGHAREAELSTAHGGVLASVDAVGDRGSCAVASEVVAAVGARPVYITFDVDGVDPAFAPGTGTPVPGGLSSREVIRFLRALAGVRIVGMDVVEVCPPLDHADITSHLAAHLLFEGLALAALEGRRLSADPLAVPASSGLAYGK